MSAVETPVRHFRVNCVSQHIARESFKKEALLRPSITWIIVKEHLVSLKMFFCQKVLRSGLLNDTAYYLCCPPVLLHLSFFPLDINIFQDFNINSGAYMPSHRLLQIEPAFILCLKYIITEYFPPLPRNLFSPLFLLNIFLHKRYDSIFMS